LRRRQVASADAGRGRRLHDPPDASDGRRDPERETRTRDEEVLYLKRQLEAANKEIDDLRVKFAIIESRMGRWGTTRWRTG
jgi:hypothetical protein